jgi:heme oxygenase
VLGMTETIVEESSTVDTQENKIKKKQTDENNPRLTGLALQLDEGTRKSHSVAQNSAFVTGFFKGLSTKESYRNLMTSLYFVYQVMEQDAFDRTQCPYVRAMDDPELRRLTALEQDMDYFYGSDWKNVGNIRPSPATQAYVARVQQVTQNEPYLLVAHQYTRYSGDLFGGQMMGGMAQRSLNLEPGKGVAFYQFPNIFNTNEFIAQWYTRFAQWYTRLNALELTDEQKGAIVDEANLVFDLNIGILQELDGSPFSAIWTMTVNSIKARLGF